MSVSAKVSVDLDEGDETSEPGAPTSPNLRRRFRKLAIGVALSGVLLAGAAAAFFRRGRR